MNFNLPNQALLFRRAGWNLLFPFSLNPVISSPPDILDHGQQKIVAPKTAPVDMSSGEASHFTDGETEDGPRIPCSCPLGAVPGCTLATLHLN